MQLQQEFEVIAHDVEFRVELRFIFFGAWNRYLDELGHAQSPCFRARLKRVRVVQIKQDLAVLFDDA